MTSLGDNLSSFLKAQTAIAAKVGNNVYHAGLPQGPLRSFIYLIREGSREERHLGQQGDSAFSHTFAVEAISESGREADDLATLIRGLDGSSGTFGDTTIRGMFVQDQNDDYAPKGIGSHLGHTVCALSVEVIP